MRNSFIFYRSFYESLSELSMEAQGRLFNAICAYSLDETTPDFSGVEKAIFTLIKPQLDANIARYKNGENGGRPRKNAAENNQTETKPKPKNNQTETKPKGNKNYNVNENENKNDNAKPKIGINDLSVIHIKEWLDEKRISGKYLTVDEHALLEKFKNYCASKGKTYRDYVAAFRNAFEWDNPPKRKIKTDNDDMALQKKILRGEI